MLCIYITEVNKNKKNHYISCNANCYMTKTLFLLIALLLGFATTAASTQVARSNIYDPIKSTLGQITSSNHTFIIGDIVSFSRHDSSAHYQLWSDTYTVFHIAGYVVTANGKEKLKGNYWFRWGDMNDTRAQNQVDSHDTDQLFIFKDGRRSHDVRIYLENERLKFYGNSPVAGIVDGFFVPFVSRKNTNCGHSFRDDPALTVVNGDKIQQHDIAQEKIDVHLGQFCNKGKLRRTGKKTKGLTEEEFVFAVSTYIKETSSKVSIPRTEVLPRYIGPSTPRLRITKYHQDHMEQILDVNNKTLREWEESGLIENLTENSRAFIAFSVERADFLGVPYSDRLNNFRNEYFTDYPRPTHAIKRQRPKGLMRRFPSAKTNNSD